MPDAMAPMMPTLVAQACPHPDWIFEPKLDGYRAITMIADGRVRMLSRNHPDMAHPSEIDRRGERGHGEAWVNR